MVSTNCVDRKKVGRRNDPYLEDFYMADQYDHQHQTKNVQEKKYLHII